MKNESEMKKTKKVSNKKKQKQISVFALLLIVAVVLVIIFGCILVNCIIQTIRYKTYTNQMYYYGYNELYSNKRATAYQKVTNMDMLKVVLGAVNNTTDVTKFTLQEPTDEITADELWYDAAKDIGLADSIVKKDLNKRATVIDAVIAMMKTLEWSLGIEVEQANLQMSEQALSKFSNTDKTYIAKAVAIGIIANEDASIKNTTIIKGELNKLIIELANKYATFHYDTVELDENGFVIKSDIHIVTNESELPNTSTKYPYVVSNIEKNIYDIDFRVENEDNFKTPKEVYSEMGYLYSQIDETISRYFEKILNIDYTTIDTTTFSYNVSTASVYSLTEEQVKEYVDYVKENKIVLKGSAEPLLPIIYYTGERYIVRTKITFEVISSDTEYNLLFGDERQSVKYNGKEITMYVDLPMGLTLNSNSLLVDVDCNALLAILQSESIQVEGGN